MGAAIRALGDTYKLLRHNPVILALGWVAFVALSIGNVVLGFIPLIGNLLAFLIFPAALAGLMAMIYAGRNGDAGADTFLSGISDHYPRLLGAYLLVGIPLVIVVAIGLVGIAFALPMGAPTDPGVGSTAASTGAGTGAGIASTAMLAAFGFALLLGVAWMLLQFFGAAIVADDAGIVESFGTSLSLFLSDPLSVIGFTLVRVVVSGVILVGSMFLLSAMGLGAVGMLSGSSTDPLAAGGAFLIVLLLYFLVLLPLWRVVTRTYYVAYFNRRQAQRP